MPHAPGDPLSSPPKKPKSKMVTSFWYPGHGLIACDTPGDKQSSFRNTTTARRDQQATSKPQASLAPPLPKRKSQIVNPLLLLCNMENTCHSPRDDRRVTPIACVSKARNFCKGGSTQGDHSAWFEEQQTNSTLYFYFRTHISEM